MVHCPKQKPTKVWEKGSLNNTTFESAFWFSRITFWWVNAFFRKGYVGQLSNDDLPPLSDVDDCSRTSNRLERFWNEEIQGGRTPSLARAVIRNTWTAMVFPTLLYTIADVQKLLQPYLVGQLLGYLYPDSTMSRNEALLYAASMGVSGLIFLFTEPFVHFLLKRIGMRLRASISGLIYRKVVRLNSKVLHCAASGKLINLLSTDVERFNQVIDFLPVVLCTPIEAAIIFYFLYRYVGVASLFALAAICIMIPLSSLAGYVSGRLRSIGARWADRRIGVINETLAAIKLIKMYCWEKALTKIVHRFRKKEITILRKGLSVRNVALGISKLSMRISIAAIFIGQWALGRSISTGTVYIAMGWLSVVSVNLRILFTIYSTQMAETVIALRRLQAFLSVPEEENELTQYVTKDNNNCGDSPIVMTDVSASWTTKSGDLKDTSTNENVSNRVQGFQLEDITLDIKKGELVAVIGPVGSGKTSLLLTLLGELPVHNGTVYVGGKMGFAPQLPWVFHDTLRENIILGETLNESRYKEVLNASALLHDIEKMPYKDFTLVGEKGLMLSGGQKTRVTLARALYRDADTYLFDDPLSAVDTEVGRHLFEKCIRGYLEKKTRILVTHQLQYLKYVDKIIIMKEGRVDFVGTFGEMQDKGIHLTTFLSEELLGDDNVIQSKDVDFPTKNSKKDKVKEEDRKIGSTDYRVYWEYLKATKAWFLLPCFLVLSVAGEALLPLSDVYFVRWTESCGNREFANSSAPSTFDHPNNTHSTYCDGVSVEQRNYLITFGATALLTMVSLQIFAWFIMTASQTLHDKMFPAVMNTKMRFFDTNPMGRIFNRFSRDMGFIDVSIPFLTVNIFTTVLQLLSYIIMICVVNPWMLIPLAPIVVIMVMVKRYCGKTTNDTKRLAAVAKSPVFSHVSDTLIGLQCIRAYKLAPKFIKRFDSAQNVHTSAFFLYQATFRGFSFRCLFVVLVFLNIAVFSSIFLKDELEAGLAALTFVYIISFMEPFELFMRKCSMYENRMTSVERVLSYTKLMPEPDNPRLVSPDNWPSTGEIEMKDVCLKYFEGGPTVLKNITCKINGGEKVGVVGRTGTGKSSIIAMLLRMAEVTGDVYIDGVNVKSVSLQELRDQISVIPQDPILLGSTLRTNLDLFTRHTDEHIWRVLDEVHLKEMVEKLPGQLYSEISEGGSNFSVGERQLLCLVRTILRQNKILILDEATANVDLETDEHIRETIQRLFSHCTVVTIAHRLHTIMDSDRVMLMDNGELKEFDCPHLLLQNHNGIFTRLVEQTGKESSAQLHERARRSFDLGNPAFINNMNMLNSQKWLRKVSNTSLELISVPDIQEYIQA